MFNDQSIFFPVPLQRVSPADIISQRKFEYSVSLPDGSELNAWSYTHGNATLNFLVNDDCVSVITSASLGGALAMSNYIFDVVTGKCLRDLILQKKKKKKKRKNQPMG